MPPSWTGLGECQPKVGPPPSVCDFSSASRPALFVHFKGYSSPAEPASARCRFPPYFCAHLRSSCLVHGCSPAAPLSSRAVTRWRITCSTAYGWASFWSRQLLRSGAGCSATTRLCLPPWSKVYSRWPSWL